MSSDRILEIQAEDRVAVVVGEIRLFDLDEEDRVAEVTPEIRMMEVLLP